jgi:multidrug efflux pump subunit AcrA (membrane-fusion protein)
MNTLPRLRFPASFCGPVLLACLALAGCGKTAPPAAEESHPAPVKVVTAKPAVLGEWTELLGTTQPLPDRVARVSAAVEGHVLSVLGEGQGASVAEGQRVKAGQVIVQLDDRIARANHDKVAAQLAEFQEQKKQAQYTVELAGIEVKRLEGLLKGGKNGGLGALIPQIELDKARISRKDAESKQAALEAKQAGLEAELKALDAQLDFYKLRAPIAGQLGLLQVMPGQTIPPATSVAEVIDLDEVDVLCYAPPHVTARLALGQTARLAADPKAAGKVVYIAVQAQPETGNFAVKVRFPNKDLALRANTVLRVRVLTQPEKERLTVPEAALMEDQEPPLVVVVKEVKTEKNEEGKEEKLGKARKLRAVLGVRDRDRHLVEIVRLETPEKGEPVPVREALFVIEGGNGLHDDDALKLEEEHAKVEKH